MFQIRPLKLNFYTILVFLHDKDIDQKYSYEVFDGKETDLISHEEYRQHGNLVYRFGLGARGAYEYSLSDISKYLIDQCAQFQTRLQQLRNDFQLLLLIDTPTTTKIYFTTTTTIKSNHRGYEFRQ